MCAALASETHIPYFQGRQSQPSFDFFNKEPKHIIILGAGMAGLAAAYELETLGYRVTILEADESHHGGRVRTLRFGNGLYGEAGAMRVPRNHHLTRHYIREFGLRLRPFLTDNPLALYYYRGQRVRQRNESQLTTGMSNLESQLGAKGLWQIVVSRALTKMSSSVKRQLLDWERLDEDGRHWDGKSLARLLSESGLSNEAQNYLSQLSALSGNLGDAATEYLREELNSDWTSGFDEIVGGTDLLAKGFVERLHHKPMMGCRVVSIEQDVINRKVRAV